MALNSRQVGFIMKMQALAADMEEIYTKAFHLAEAFDEEFDDAQDNSLLDVTADLDSVYNFSSTDVKAFINHAVDNYINFYTNSAVATREYGKDIRRIK